MSAGRFDSRVGVKDKTPPRCGPGSLKEIKEAVRTAASRRAYGFEEKPRLTVRRIVKEGRA